MTKTITNTIQHLFSGSLNQKLLLVLVLLFGAYSFCIVRAVAAINERKSLYAEIRTHQAKVADLEIKYFAVASEIDTDKIAELGFVDSQAPLFAYTHPNADTVALVR